MTSRTLTAAAFSLTNVLVPLFPSFITLAGVPVPGVSVLPAFPAAILLAIVAVLAIVFGWRLLATAPRDPAPTLLPLVALLGAALLSAAIGFDPPAGLACAGIFALGIVWHLGILRYYADPIVARAMYWSHVVTCGAASMAAIVMVVIREPAAQYAIAHGRAVGTFVLPGELAGYLVVLLPICYGIVAASRAPSLRVCAALALVVGLGAMALTYSRAGWVGLGAAAAFVAVTRARDKRMGAIVAAVLVCAAIAAVLLAFDVAHNPSEDFTRLPIWRAAVSIAVRFPLTGVGPFAFERLYALVRAPDADATAYHAHSVYLTFLTETGVLGTAAACWLWWRFVSELRRRLASASPRAATLATAITAGLVGTLVQGLIDTVTVVVFGLWLPTMALALASARDGCGIERE